MRRIMLIGALVATFGLGVLSGGRLPAARSQGEVLLNMPTNPQTTSTVVAVQQNRWQIFTMPAVGNAPPVVILLDGQTGASFLLSPSHVDRVPYVWEHLDRTP